MSASTKHAVIDDWKLYHLSHDVAGFETCPVRDLAHAWQVGSLYGITHFWVMPGSGIDKMGQRWLDTEPTFQRFIHSDPDGQPVFARCNQGRNTYTIHAGYPRAFGWQIETPADILRTIDYLEEHLGVAIQWGNGHVGREILKAQWVKRPQVLRDATVDMRDLPFLEAARDLMYRRELTVGLIGQTIHHFDKNSTYLSADRSVKTGIGDPVHLTGEGITPGLPGVYRVTVEPYVLDAFDGVTLPVGINIIEPGQEWITNDLLIYALQKGHTITIREAWVFEDYAKILDEMAWTIWTARKNLNQPGAHFPNERARQNAYNTCKGVALVAVGGFAMNKQVHPGLSMIHPNWWADTVGKARVNMLANIEKFSLGAGLPVCVEVDGLYYISRDPNYRTAVPGILDRQGELGGYKYVGSCRLTRELYDQAQGVTTSELAALFKGAAKHG
jgi:hypothetical protein